MNATLVSLMFTPFKRIALSLLLMSISSFTQVNQYGFIQFISNPPNVSIYSPQNILIGRTPFFYRIPVSISAQTVRAGEWQLGPFKADVNDGAPIIFYPKLVMTEHIINQYNTQHNFNHCWVFNVPLSQHRNASTQPLPDAVPTFFACNHWVDANQNGSVDPDEWRGIKNHFRPNETITFVAYIDKGVGIKFRYDLRDPNNNRPDLTLQTALNGLSTPTLSTETAKFNKGAIRVEYSVRDLIGCPTGPTTPASPAGDWKMYWYIEDILVNITKVSLK